MFGFNKFAHIPFATVQGTQLIQVSWVNICPELPIWANQSKPSDIWDNQASQINAWDNQVKTDIPVRQCTRR